MDGAFYSASISSCCLISDSYTYHIWISTLYFLCIRLIVWIMFSLIIFQIGEHFGWNSLFHFKLILIFHCISTMKSHIIYHEFTIFPYQFWMSSVGVKEQWFQVCLSGTCPVSRCLLKMCRLTVPPVSWDILFLISRII